MIEVQKAKETNTNICNVETYKQYLKRAAYLMNTKKERTPLVIKLIKKGMPIIDDKIEKIIKEIQEKANIAYQQSKNTPTEEIAYDVNQEVQNWYIGNQEQLVRNLNRLIFILKQKIPLIPENKFIHEQIEKIRNEKDITKQYKKICYSIEFIQTEVTMIDKCYKIEIGDNASVGEIIQGEHFYIEKSEKNSFDAREFSSVIEELLIAIKKNGLKDSNTDLALEQLEIVKLKAENGEDRNEVIDTLNKSIKYLSKSEEVVKSSTEIGKFLMKAGSILGTTISWL